MVKNIFISSFFLFFCAAGCLDVDPSVNESARSNKRLDTPEGMVWYLESLRLPPLKSVEQWENEYGPGVKLTTEHYNIYTTLLEPLMLSQIPGFVESAYRSYQSQLPSPIDTVVKLDIYLFAERMEWEIFTREFAGQYANLYLKINMGAYYLNGSCVAYNIGRERTFSVIGHEGWHQFNSRHFQYRLPSWLNEGIAMLFEANRYDRGLFVFEPANNMQRLGALKRTLMAGNMIPLSQLISLNPGEVLGSSQEDSAAAFYSQSYALIRFLREDDYGRRREDYHRLLYDGLMGNWSLPARLKEIAANRNIPLTIGWNRAVGTMLFEDYIGENLEKIEKDYVTFCKKIVFNVRIAN
ncbi:MAG: hypothetical protein FVQ80_03460 [Planctomycetes bacterium]|nr:hypothetical protein [Planctomycetota bacterium]